MDVDVFDMKTGHFFNLIFHTVGYAVCYGSDARPVFYDDVKIDRYIFPVGFDTHTLGGILGDRGGDPRGKILRGKSNDTIRLLSRMGDDRTDRPMGQKNVSYGILLILINIYSFSSCS